MENPPLSPWYYKAWVSTSRPLIIFIFTHLKPMHIQYSLPLTVSIKHLKVKNYVKKAFFISSAKD